MTKEQFINRWWPACTTTFVTDLDALIAHEVAKVQEEKTNKIEITPHTLVEVNRAFRALKRDTESYVHKVFGDDGVFDAMKEISEAYKYYFGEYPTEQIPSTPNEQPAPKYPIGGYAPGHYTCICSNCKIEFMGDKRAVQCEPCAVKTTSQPAKQPAPFDKYRFERMFRAVVMNGEWHGDEVERTEYIIKELDAYYAEKQGGNNE